VGGVAGGTGGRRRTPGEEGNDHRALSTRLHRLEEKTASKPLKPQPEVDEHQRRASRKLLVRFFQALNDALPLFAEPQQQRLQAQEPFAAWVLEPWVRSLLCGSSALPPISTETMQRLLAGWLDPHVASMPLVCLECLLCRPRRQPPPLKEWKLLPGKVPLEGPPPWYDVPEFFKLCPHCQSASYRWEHLR
jgi:hypothetical protein